jgi:pyruvate dehydrogenase (quinone)
VTWAARYLHTNGRRRLIGSFSHGSMANALPQAIGALAADPSRQAIALAGDGGLAMLLGELLTAVQLRLPVKVVVFDNASLNFVELEMKAAGIVNFGTGLDNPALLDVLVERQELSIPPTIAPAQMKGFALYAIRSVLSGRGDELIDLARANVRQLL